MAISDNLGHIIAPMEAHPVNLHDSSLFDESFTNLLEIADDLLLNLHGSYLTLDPGFDSEANRNMVRFADLVPVIKPNPRREKDRKKIYQRLDEFEEYEDIYKKRSTIERCFAWEDTYRKLVIRYEILQSTFMGFRYLAYSMVNLRSLVGREV